MKKLLCILLLISNLSYAQKQEEKISVTFKKVSLEKAFKKIEKKSSFTFYYKSSWIDSKTKVSGSFKNSSVAQILDAILQKTVLNYYITPDNRIILLQNTLIYNSLPQNFFDKTVVDEIVVKKNVVVEKATKPQKVISQNLENTTVLPFKNTVVQSNGKEIIKIGKESRRRKRNYRLTGIVTNSITGKPIPDLAVTIQNKKAYSVTDKKGFYSIKIPSGENILKFKALGYIGVSKNIVMYNNGVLDVHLIEKSEMLDEIVVETSKINNVKSAITGVTKIEVSKIKNIPLVLGERDIMRVATTLPGISTAGEGASGFNVRGGKTDQNLILLDNGVLYNPTHFFGIFSAINPFTTGDVTIYKGSIPAEFGGRLSSVFDIKTKTTDKQKFSLEGSFGPVTSNITIETPIVKDISSLVFGARGTYSDWILKSLNNPSLSNSEASFYDVILKYKHKLSEKDQLSTSAYYSKDAYSITSDSLFTYSNRVFSVEWNRRFNDKHRMDVIFANSQYQFNIDYEGNSNANFTVGYKVNENLVKARLHYLYNDKHSFTYGISSKLYAVEPGSLLPNGTNSIVEPLIVQRDKALESALFFSDKYKVNEKFSVDAGVRLSLFLGLGPSEQRRYLPNNPRNQGTLVETVQVANNEVYTTYGGPEFRISTRYLLTPTSSVKASINNSFQYIHTLSNNTTLSPTDTWKLSDLNIKPQQAIQFSLGYFKNSEDNLYEFSIEGYYKLLDNMLDYKVGAELLLNTSIETEVLQGNGIAYGVELLLRKSRGRLNGWLGYSYSRSLIQLDSPFDEERVNNGNYFPSNFDKPHDISLVANYKLTKRYSLSANFAYQTGRPVTYPIGNYIFNGVEYVAYSNRNQFRIPDYYRLDVGVNIEGNHKLKKLAHSFWNFSIYNVLGRNNPYSVFFVTEGGEIKAYKSTIFSVPIPTLTYNIKF